MPWYKLSDLNAEIAALRQCISRRVDIVHFLDGEHSGQFLPHLVKVAGLSAVRTVATFHQPPEMARELDQSISEIERAVRLVGGAKTADDVRIAITPLRPATQYPQV